MEVNNNLDYANDKSLGSAAFNTLSTSALVYTAAKSLNHLSTGGAQFFLNANPINTASTNGSAAAFIFEEMKDGVKYSNIQQLGSQYLDTSTNKILDPAKVESAILNNQKNVGALKGVAINPMGGLGMALGLGMTAWTMYDSYQTDGMQGMAEAALASSIAYPYGFKATMRTETINSANISKYMGSTKFKQMATNMGLDANDLQTKVTNGSTLKLADNNRWFVNNMTGKGNIPYLSVGLGMMGPIMGAAVFGNLGFGMGKAIGNGISNMMGQGDSMALGTLGGIAGAMAMAPVGASILRSFKGALGFGALVGGGAILSKTAGGFISEGMKRISQNKRGLDFATDAQPYFSRSAVTMRQRALQAMSNSVTNARSALGNEASIMHMNRDYFATYGRL
jgi:hypothetical protein